jgi:magnesium-transporting ATPase (P-type)
VEYSLWKRLWTFRKRENRENVPSLQAEKFRKFSVFLGEVVWNVSVTYSSFAVVLLFELYKGATQKASFKAYPSAVAVFITVCLILTIVITSSASNIHFPGNKTRYDPTHARGTCLFHQHSSVYLLFLQGTSFFIPNPPSQNLSSFLLLHLGNHHITDLNFCISSLGKHYISDPNPCRV